MRFSTASAVLAVAGFASAQLSAIPPCAIQCLLGSVSASGCAATDYVCQCTTGQQIIAKQSIACLCKSTCTPAELEQTNKATNNLCSSALAAVSSTYAPLSYPTNECAILAGSTTSTAAASTTTAVVKTTSTSVAVSSTATVVSSAPMSSAAVSSAAATSTAASSAPAKSSASPTTASPGAAGPMVTMPAQLLLGGIAAAGALIL